jgi:hypothetical protein
MSKPLTRRKEKRLHAQGGTRGKNGFKLVSYCIICNKDKLSTKAKTDELVSVGVGHVGKKATCKNKHTWELVR